MSAKPLIVLAALALLGAQPSSAPAERPGASKDIAAACGTRDGWSEPAPPARIHGRSWYVGTCGITVVLVETSAGLVLIDTGPEDAAPHVLANIKALGFDFLGFLPPAFLYIALAAWAAAFIGLARSLLRRAGVLGPEASA